MPLILFADLGLNGRESNLKNWTPAVKKYPKNSPLKKGVYPLGMESMGMKITQAKNGKGKASLKISKREWVRLGQEAGWPIPQDAVVEESPETEKHSVEVKKYSDRTWAVYIEGNLLCVTAYKKGAMAVKELIEELYQRIRISPCP